MPHPVPENPTNVQHTNPYTGVDRGLMVLGGKFTGFARIHAARWICNGPPAAVSRIEFKVMRYASMPTTPAQYAAGTLLKAPDGSEWFDCLAKGDCSKPIMLEYYAKNVFQTYYCIDANAEMLSQAAKDASKLQALEFTKTIGRSANIIDLEQITAFNASSTEPLKQSSVQLKFSYGPANMPINVTLNAMTEIDAVREVLKYIKAH